MILANSIKKTDDSDLNVNDEERTLSNQKIIAALCDIRVSFKNNSFSPCFASDYDLYNYSAIFNCYAYAMQFNFDYSKIDSASNPIYPWYSPGFLSNSLPDNYNDGNLLDAFFNDCKFLDLSWEESSILDDDIQEGAYKIAIMLETVRPGYHTDAIDFHFVRQNIDHTWSEKHGIYSPVELVDKPMSSIEYTLIKTVKISRNS